MSKVIEMYRLAKERYAQIGVDTDRAIAILKQIPLSIHCWQGDDGKGFEQKETDVNTGIMATGNYLGRARNAEELRSDLSVALDLIPGRKKLNLHSIYAETNGKKVERNELEYCYFENWVAFAKEKKIGMDFNPTIYNHVNMKDGYSLSSPDKSIRAFWIEHVKRCRAIADQIGRQLESPCVNNIWISDGSKDNCLNKGQLRENLMNSLDEIFQISYDKAYLLDALEPKLFGIGTESFVVGSLEFYLGYAIKNQKLLCLDTGHFHPTELVSEKISSLLAYCDRLLLHLSRGVRWDSDHVTALDAELMNIFTEIQALNAFDRVHCALDYFDASINRISAWVIGARNVQKAILKSLLDPIESIRKAEQEGDLGTRLALMEESKTLPFGAVYDYVCESCGIPVGENWLKIVKDYEKKVLVNRI